jgi:hypothetical protein
MEKAMRLMRAGSADISRSASWSCENFLIALPVNVRYR